MSRICLSPTLGPSYHELSMPSGAQTCLESSAGTGEKHPEVYGDMGMDYEKLQKTDAAIDAYTAQTKAELNDRLDSYAKQGFTVLKKPARISSDKKRQRLSELVSKEHTVP